jgi:hypothetical protein
MSKIGRASRNASLKRVESITAAKTIASAESGEVYFIDYSSAATIAVTLPALKAGAYFRFQWTTVQADNSAVIEFKTAGAAGSIRGVLQTMEVDGTGPLAEADGGSATKVSIDGNPNVSIGSYIDVLCDGTYWNLNGIIYTVAGGAAADCVTWDA